MTTTSDGEPWETRLARWLIAAGLAGKTNREIATYLRPIPWAQIEPQLNDWREDRKVDRYTTKAHKTGRGRPATLWRATTEMLKDD